MTAIVRATCSRCGGGVELTPSDITLEVMNEDGVSYSFSCPRQLCGERSFNLTSRRNVAHLIRVGVVSRRAITNKEIRQLAEALHRTDDVWRELGPGQPQSPKSP